ncbi:uncharacterized protein [Hetaerina americana]|uniref:uncharacterized protein n=1 Tax=Hetaerina americana TaxID=62018 RepID=UPI003A7F318A
MSGNPEEQPPSYEEAMGSSLPNAPSPSTEGQPETAEDNASAVPKNTPEEDAEERKKKKAEEAGWRTDLLQPSGEPSGETPPIPAPRSRNQRGGQDSACAVSPEPQSQEERNRLKAEEAGWKGSMMSEAGPSSVSGPGILPSPPLVLPPGLQPLIILDTLFLRGNYERGKGRRYKVTNKDGGAVLYARSVRRGHHRPKDFQLYDSTRTAVVGQLAFTQAADNSMYASLECPSRVSLATIRAEEYAEQSPTTDSSQSAVPNAGMKYTICNVLGQPVFVVPAPSVMNTQAVQIKVYSAVSPDTAVADIFWDVDEEVGEAADEAQSTFGDRDDSADARRVKIVFPLDLEVKMKAAIVALCFLKDKIDHRMAKSGYFPDALRGPVNDVLNVAFGHRGRRRHRF